MPTERSPTRRELTDATADQAVCTSHLKDIKISAFWRARPKLWFVSLESEFAAYKVRSDETMYRSRYDI